METLKDNPKTSAFPSFEGGGASTLAFIWRPPCLGHATVDMSDSVEGPRPCFSISIWVSTGEGSGVSMALSFKSCCCRGCSSDQAPYHSSGLLRSNPDAISQHQQCLAWIISLSCFSSFLDVDKILNTYLAWFHEQKTFMTLKSSIKDKQTEGWSPHLPSMLEEKSWFKSPIPPAGVDSQSQPAFCTWRHRVVYGFLLTPGRDRQGISLLALLIQQPGLYRPGGGLGTTTDHSVPDRNSPCLRCGRRFL